jgi:hypothetical protein
MPFQSLDFERTWWRLLWAYVMKVIVSVRDEGYCERTWWRLLWAYVMKVILSVRDEGYCERTWWRLFQKRTVCTKFDIYVFTIRHIHASPVFLEGYARMFQNSNVLNMGDNSHKVYNTIFDGSIILLIADELFRYVNVSLWICNIFHYKNAQCIE